MNPDTTLKRMRNLTRAILRLGNSGTRAEELAELCESLDQWLTGGNPKPQDWS